ncbi:alpha/beta hydrolase [Planobispora longispora]|uniref:alpha/beta hydrolase n=1 Tax=Planobispora longispora TaxID=28887 RepID=UPI00194239C9|nr:alpha/beta fold hydrolase [Planobispora longispora]
MSEQCDAVPSGAERVTLKARDGVRLGAALLGPPDASIGVVLSHGATQSLCDWLTEIDGIAAETRARFLIPDRRGGGSSEGRPDVGSYVTDIVDALHWLKKAGAVRLAVAGTSYGAPIAVAAGQEAGARSAEGAVRLPVCAVIAISPLRSIEEPGGSIQPLDTHLAVPGVWIAAEKDNTGIAANARSLFDELRHDEQGRLVLVPGEDHSLALVQNHPEARLLIKDAILSCPP